MEYLTRPVFEFVPNALLGKKQRFSFDLRPISIGFGADVFSPLQSNVVHGFEFTVELRDDSTIKDFDVFTAALHGRAQGFWLPSHESAMEVVSISSSTIFNITDQDLTTTWQNHPAKHLCFWDPSTNSIKGCAAITSVVDNGNSTEQVTIDTAVESLSSSWLVFWLYYVRLADDTEEGEFIANGSQLRKIKVVELPSEYAAIETGTSPVYLYHFWMNTDGSNKAHWRFTSFAEDITSNSNEFVSFPITHKALKRSISAQGEEVEIESVYDAANPLALFIPFTLPRPLWIEIHEAYYSAPDTITLLFTGQIANVTAQGKRLSAKASCVLDVMERKIPRFMISSACNHSVFDSGCGLLAASFLCSVTISQLSPTVQVAGASLSGKTENYFAGGWLETGTGTGFEIRSILASTAEAGGIVTLYLNMPLSAAILSQAASIYPGCDRRSATCTSKFNNFVRFSGFPFIPQDNLTLKAIKAQQHEVGKK